MRQNPAQGRTDTTVLFAVGPTTASRYNLVLVDNGEVKGGMTMKAGKTYCQIRAVNSLKGWGPLLYRAAFTWAHNMGFATVYSDTTVFSGAHKVWNHFVDIEGIGERANSPMGKYKLRVTGPYSDVPVIQLSQEDYEAYGPKVPGLRGPQSAIGDWPYVPLSHMLDERYPVIWPSGPYPKR